MLARQNKKGLHQVLATTVYLKIAFLESHLKFAQKTV